MERETKTLTEWARNDGVSLSSVRRTLIKLKICKKSGGSWLLNKEEWGMIKANTRFRKKRVLDKKLKWGRKNGKNNKRRSKK